jgi:Fe-Mn family superoxide dismutase
MAAPIAPKAYKPREFKLSGLKGISDQTLEMHFGLYQGYVKNTNLLTEHLVEMHGQGKAQGTNPLYAEVSRRLGFEYSGMILHEYYFENMKKDGTGLPSGSSKTAAAITATFGSLDNWLTDFKAVGAFRGVGWAILFQDPVTGRVTNQWVTLHQDNVPVSFKPLLVMDAWEHAYLLDYKAQRAPYIEAFFQNVDWDAVERRVKEAAAVRPVAA